MTKKIELTSNGTKIGTATLYDGDKTFDITVSTHVVKDVYSALTRKTASGAGTYSYEWAMWRYLPLKIFTFKDYTTDNYYYCERTEQSDAIKKEFGRGALQSSVTLKIDHRTLYDYLHSTSPNTDIQCYRRDLSTRYAGARMGGRTCYDLIIFPYSYVKAIPRKEKDIWGGETTVLNLEFYNSNDVCTLRLRSGGYYDANSCVAPYPSCKAPCKEKIIKTNTYIIENEIPVMEDSGCIDCKDSEYHINNGVYLRCTLCGKEVKEIDYDGMHYPEYCNRNIAKKIRSYEGRKATLA